MLNRNDSTISGELPHNPEQRGCRPKQAHLISIERHAMNARTIDEATWQFTQDKLLEQSSPEQISADAAISHGIPEKLCKQAGW